MNWVREISKKLRDKVEGKKIGSRIGVTYREPDGYVRGFFIGVCGLYWNAEDGIMYSSTEDSVYKKPIMTVEEFEDFLGVKLSEGDVIKYKLTGNEEYLAKQGKIRNWEMYCELLGCLGIDIENSPYQASIGVSGSRGNIKRANVLEALSWAEQMGISKEDVEGLVFECSSVEINAVKRVLCKNVDKVSINKDLSEKIRFHLYLMEE